MKDEAHIHEIGVEATTTVAAWPLGVDMKEKPLYSLTVDGLDPRVVNGDLLVISRGLAEIDWWSIHNVGSGAHLFDTYVPLVQFSIDRDVFSNDTIKMSISQNYPSPPKTVSITMELGIDR